jgi:hypothetical protein
MKRLIKYVSLVTIIAFSSIYAAAQETGGVKGKVRTAKGDGIAAASVTARQNGEDVKTTTADEKGNFTLENLKTGNYNLVFSKSGYSSGVMYNVEIKKKKINDLGDRLVLIIDQGTQVIIKGSVFNPDGRSVGGAEVKIEKVLSDGSYKKVGSYVSTYSGEFTFRFAEGAAKYRITASAKGASASKEIEVDSAAIYRLAINLEEKK